MARKRDMIQIQTEVTTQEEWEQEIGRPGLTVADVYPDWCGPCTSMVGTLKKIKFELGDDMLNYVVARSDDIDALETFRNRSEPLFIFFGSGQPVYQLRGAHSPLLAKKIVEELEKEKKVLAGEAERSVISLVCDAPAAVQLPPEAAAAPEDEAETAESLNARRLRSELRVRRALAPYSILVVAPAAADRREEILPLLESHGFNIELETTKTLTEEEVDALVTPPPAPASADAGESATEQQEPEPASAEEGESPAGEEGGDGPPEGDGTTGEEQKEAEGADEGKKEAEQEDPEAAARREAAKEKLLEGECALLALKDVEFSEEKPYRWLTVYLGRPPAPPPGIEGEPAVPPPTAGGQHGADQPPADDSTAAEPETDGEPAPDAEEPEPAPALAAQLRELLVEAAPAVYTPETVTGQWAALRSHFPELHRAPEPPPPAPPAAPAVTTGSRQVALVVFAGDREEAGQQLADAGFTVLHSGVNQLTEEVAGQLLAGLEGGESQIPALMAAPVMAAAVASDGGAALAALANLDPLYLSDNPEEADRHAQMLFTSWGVEIGSLLSDGADGAGSGVKDGAGGGTAETGAATEGGVEGASGEDGAAAEGGAEGTEGGGEADTEGGAVQEPATDVAPAEPEAPEDAPAEATAEDTATEEAAAE